MSTDPKLNKPGMGGISIFTPSSPAPSSVGSSASVAPSATGSRGSFLSSSSVASGSSDAIAKIYHSYEKLCQFCDHKLNAGVTISEPCCFVRGCLRTALLISYAPLFVRTYWYRDMILHFSMVVDELLQEVRCFPIQTIDINW